MIYDEARTIDIKDLKKYFTGDPEKGVLMWSNYRGVTGQVLYFVDPDPLKVRFEYYVNESFTKQAVEIVSTESNLNGEILYFFCSRTQKRCRKLYFTGGGFFHREALKGLYSCQTESKLYRKLVNTYGRHFKADAAYQEMYSKHFKKYYNGKPTKRYTRLLQVIQQSE